MSQLLRWQVGAVRITRVQELEAPGMRFIVPQRRSTTWPVSRGWPVSGRQW